MSLLPSTTTLPQRTQEQLGQELLIEVCNVKSECNVKRALALIDQGANIEASSYQSSFGGPLMWAIIRDHTEIAQKLIERGANIEAKDEHGDTPLMETAICGRIEIAKMLLSKGANPFATNKNGTTSLDYALSSKRLAVIELFQQSLQAAKDSAAAVQKTNHQIFLDATDCRKGISKEVLVTKTHRFKY